jgi:5'-nucleotidase
MNILLTNDDGIFAPGLRALLVELRKIGNVTVVAPATEQSAVGHSITLMQPLIVQEVFDEHNQRIGWGVEGRPADCVKLAITQLLPKPPDLIVSGINAGSNAGINVLYSGTVAAAIEGAFFGITSIAISLEYRKPPKLNFPNAAIIGRQMVEQILKGSPKPGQLFNVNIPALDEGPPLGVRVSPQGTAPYDEKYDRRTDPRGRTYFWIASNVTCPPDAGESDVRDLSNRYITVTPLHFNLTDPSRLQEMQSWQWQCPVYPRVE